MVSTKHRFVVSAAIWAVMTVPTLAAADHSGQAQPSLHSDGVPPTTKGSCLAEKQAFASSDIPQSTVSDTMANLVGAVIKPTVTKGCLVVDFTGETYVDSGDVLRVQVLLDGTPMVPGVVQLSGADGTGCCARAHSFTFVAAGLSSDQHTIQVQFSNYNNTAQASVLLYTLVAHYD